MSEENLDNTIDQAINQEEKNIWPPPGLKLKEARENLNISQAHVAECLHLTVHYINALENDDYQKLPCKTFVKGYFKSYARFLNLDVDEIVRTFEQYASARDESRQNEEQVIRKRRATDQHTRWLVGATIAVVVALIAAWWFGHDQGTTTQTQALDVNNTMVPADSPPAPPVRDQSVTAELLAGQENPPRDESDTPALADEQADQAQVDTVVADPDPIDETQFIAGEAGEEAEVAVQSANLESQTAGVELARSQDDPSPAEENLYTVESDNGVRTINLDNSGDDLVELQATGTSWIEVDDGEQTRLFNDNLYAGDALTIRGEAPFNILIGNALFVDIVFNSQDIDVSDSIRSDNTARIRLEP